MALDATSTILPGRGAVFHAPVDTPAFDLDALVLTDPATFATPWESLGHTSRENTVAFSKDGGEATQVGSWEDEALRSTYSSTSWSLTVNALQVDQTTLELAFGGGTWDATNEAYDVAGSTAAQEKALFVVMFDGTNRAGFYLPNTTVTLGDAPEIDVENFFEIQLSAQILNSPTTGNRFRIYKPRPYTAAPAV